MTPAAFERLLGRTLAAGVALATSLLATGLILSLAWPGPLGDALLHGGVVALMATPVARVVLSCVEFLRERDWFFALSAFGVLVVLAMTFWTAWHK